MLSSNYLVIETHTASCATALFLFDTPENDHALSNTKIRTTAPTSNVRIWRVVKECTRAPLSTILARPKSKAGREDVQFTTESFSLQSAPKTDVKSAQLCCLRYSSRVGSAHHCPHAYVLEYDLGHFVYIHVLQKSIDSRLCPLLEASMPRRASAEVRLTMDIPCQNAARHQ